MIYHRVCKAWICVAGFFPAWLVFENVTYLCRLVFLLLIAASLLAEHNWRLLSFMQSLSHKNIDDFQSYLIHSDGFSLCPLQRYYQHAVWPTSSRLLWSPQNFLYQFCWTSSSQSAHSVTFWKLHFFGHTSRRCSKYTFCSAFLYEGSTKAVHRRPVPGSGKLLFSNERVQLSCTTFSSSSSSKKKKKKKKAKLSLQNSQTFCRG